MGDRRFTALRVIGTIFKILALTSLILGVLFAFLALILGITLREPLGVLDLDLGGALFGVAGFVVMLISAVLLFLSFYGLGEFFYVFLSIEESSRRTAYIVQQQYASYQAAFIPPPPTADYME